MPHSGVFGSTLRFAALTGLVTAVGVGSTGCQRGSARKNAVQAARSRNEAAKKPAPKPKAAKVVPGAFPDTIEVADCSALISRICKDLGEGHLGCTLSREKLPPVGDEECRRLGPRYGALLADLQVREDIRKDASPEQMKAMVQGQAPGFGDADAPVQVVEFLDFECSGCSNLLPDVELVKDKIKEGEIWAGKVRYIARMKPLSEMHANADLAAKAAIAADMQGKYWEYHDLLFANQSDLGRDKLLEMAKMAKLDLKAFARDLDSAKAQARLDKDLALAKSVTAMATPTIFVNGKRVHPATFQVAIGEAVAAAEAAVAR